MTTNLASAGSGNGTQKNNRYGLSIGCHALSAEDVIVELKTELHEGLTQEESKARLQEYGYNELVEKPRPTFLHMVMEQLNNFVVIMLLVAAFVSGVIAVLPTTPAEDRSLIEPAAILAIVILNTVLGVVQDSRAEAALAALKKMSAPDALTLRGGHRVNVPGRELVPGDIVFLEAGNFIPADVRLIEAVNLRVDEAALTGESVPVRKNAAVRFEADVPIGDRKNSAFMGTTVTYGRGLAVVASTGMKTQLGMIADMLQSVEEEETPLQKRLDHLGRTLGVATLIICGIVFVVSFLRAILGGETDIVGTIVETFMIAVSLAIAAVPEGLPAVVTISLALGMQEMVRRHALIRKLASVETLGSATVICSDKTGTLTQNEMTVTRVTLSSNPAPIGSPKVCGMLHPARSPVMRIRKCFCSIQV